MTVHEVDRTDRRSIKHFVELERALVGTHPLFWSETDADTTKRLMGRSAFSDGIEMTLLVASDGSGVARCGALVNRRWQAQKNDDAGGIGYFAAAPDATREVHEMLTRAEEWLAARGANRVIAPFNGSGLIGMGVQTDGFDESPMFPLPWSPPYYAAYLEAAGYQRRYPLVIYDVGFDSDVYRETTRRALANPRCAVRPLDKKHWNDELDLVRRLFNVGMASGNSTTSPARNSANFTDR